MNKSFQYLKCIIVLSSLGNLVLHLLHLSFYGGKRGCLAAFLSDFSSSDDSVLLQLGAKTAQLSLDGDISLDKVTVVLGTFVSTDVLFEPVIVSA